MASRFSFELNLCGDGKTKFFTVMLPLVGNIILSITFNQFWVLGWMIKLLFSWLAWNIFQLYYLLQVRLLVKKYIYIFFLVFRERFLKTWIRLCLPFSPDEIQTNLIQKLLIAMTCSLSFSKSIGQLWVMISRRHVWNFWIKKVI